MAESEPAPIWAAAAAPAAEEAVAAEAPEETAAAESGVSDDAAATEPTESDRSWETEPWSEPDAAAAAVRLQMPSPSRPKTKTVISPKPPSRRPRSPPRSRKSMPDAPMSHGSIGRTRPRCTRRRGSRPRRLLPPAARRPASSPAAGDIRTTLGQPEPELDDELLEEPTTAEQAVPWLIGVILLLAGMVIVLLALIFAGDASLGGASGRLAHANGRSHSRAPRASGQPHSRARARHRRRAPRPSPRRAPSPSRNTATSR